MSQSSGGNSSEGSSLDIDVSQRLQADQIIEEGLGLYSAGDLIGALSQWRRALDLDPGNARATEYMAYVEDHYEILDERFREARQTKRDMDPVRLVAQPGAVTGAIEDDEDAYESFEVSVAEPATGPGDSLAVPPVAQVRVKRPISEQLADVVDEGWSLEGMDDFTAGGTSNSLSDDTENNLQLPFTEESAEPGTGEITLPAVGLLRGQRDAERASWQGLADTDDGFDLSDFDDPSGAPAAAGDSGLDSAEGDGDVKVTFRRPSEPQGLVPPPFDDATVDEPAGPPALALNEGDEFADDSSMGTRQRGPTLGDELAAPAKPGGLDLDTPAVEVEDDIFEDETRERGSITTRPGPGFDDSDDEPSSNDEHLVDLGPVPGRADSETERDPTQLYQRDPAARHGATSLQLIAAELEAELDDAVPMDPSLGEESVRARVGWFIERARQENQRGQYPIAVVALDLALEEHPDSVVTQKQVHSNRDLFFEVYSNFLGDTSAVPTLSIGLESIPMSELDHRAAFLLSRIDGILSIEDILDVSGMARLEAYRHLSRLILRGIIRPGDVQ